MEKKLLIVTIDVGNETAENITIYERDDPSMVAQEFCIKYGLK
jgi:hypothetical protein